MILVAIFVPVIDKRVSNQSKIFMTNILERQAHNLNGNMENEGFATLNEQNTSALNHITHINPFADFVPFVLSNFCGEACEKAKNVVRSPTVIAENF